MTDSPYINSPRIAAVKRLLSDVWSEGRLESVDSSIASSYTIRHDPGDPWEGRTLDVAGYKERVLLSRAPVPDQRFEIVDIVEGNSVVIVTWNWAATHQGDLPGMSATGKRITMTGATVYYFEGDRITGHWQVADRLGVYRQINDNKG